MSFKCYVLFLQLPLLLWACGSDLAGTPSKSAEFGLSFFAPLAYTFPPNGVTAAAKQSIDEGIVNNLVKTDLNVAIGKGLTANQIYLYVPPTLNISFTPQAMEIEDGDECMTDGKYLARDGTVYYKCVNVSTLRARNVRAAPADPDPTTSTAEPTTEVSFFKQSTSGSMRVTIVKDRIFQD
ncbi:hypothetical protein CAEBREN_17222 [Caenorhabditis brenneri]|uniref:Lipoprotein n=1 Tax=Caenorhabditis brenneri TaxID=135651 RepID=G0PKA7_CAEBE|nr:hypothetical protein CAEBREN_17222 [Caenorhabditis brenneri]